MGGNVNYIFKLTDVIVLYLYYNNRSKHFSQYDCFLFKSYMQAIFFYYCNLSTNINFWIFMYETLHIYYSISSFSNLIWRAEGKIFWAAIIIKIPWNAEKLLLIYQTPLAKVSELSSDGWFLFLLSIHNEDVCIITAMI